MAEPTPEPEPVPTPAAEPIVGDAPGVYILERVDYQIDSAPDENGVTHKIAVHSMGVVAK